MLGILNELDLSYAAFSRATKPLAGDPTHYQEDLDKWKKSGNCFSAKSINKPFQKRE
ncbi:MAG: hypothetical protein LIP01_08830 [Tannerellaceae bacterium]|nr:hypothetical protein [Tannerellaceae bacterium]